MNKILVQIDCPASNMSYEAWIYNHMKINQILTLARQYINDVSQGLYRMDEQTVLCNEQGQILNPNMSVREADLHNASRLILI